MLDFLLLTLALSLIHANAWAAHFLYRKSQPPRFTNTNDVSPSGMMFDPEEY